MLRFLGFTSVKPSKPVVFSLGVASRDPHDGRKAFIEEPAKIVIFERSYYDDYDN